MELNKKTMGKIFVLAVCIILVYLGFQHMDVVLSFLQWLLGVMTPFIIAGCFTFFLNVPLKAIEKHLFIPKPGKPVSNFKNKMRRPLAVMISAGLFVLFVGLFLVIVIPEIGKSLSALAEATPTALAKLQNWVNELSQDNETIGEIVSGLEIDWKTISNTVVGFFQDNGANMVQSLMGILTTVLSAALNIVMGLVLSIYILAKKEKISSDAKRLLYAILPSRVADFFVELGQLTNKSFYNSITGMMMDCVLLGTLVALVMTIFGMPYASLIAVIVAIMAWIPMFGTSIGTGIGTLLILTADPVQAIWFVVIMVVIIQIDGNLIYPRVVGSNIGLPPIIVVSAVILFSSFFGIPGLLICGPVTSVIYTLVKQFVNNRLAAGNVPPEKYGIKYAYIEDAAEDERRKIERQKKANERNRKIAAYIKKLQDKKEAADNKRVAEIVKKEREKQNKNKNKKS